MESTAQVAASQGRNRIPTDWLLEFNDWSNEALVSFINDPKITNRKLKAYATWEMDYRTAFGIVVEPEE